MKKVFKIAGISLAVVFMLLLLIPILFKSRIESTVKARINEQVLASVDWDRFSLSLLRGFPDLSINLHGLSVVGVEPFEGDTLLGLERFEFRANPFSAFRGDLLVKRILLDGPAINALVLDDGSANWDIAMEAEEQEAEVAEEADSEGSHVQVSLESFAIHKGVIRYRDQSQDLEASLEGFEFELKGDLSLRETILEVQLAIEKVNAGMGGVRYLRDANLALNLDAAANLETQQFALLDNEIRINALVMGVEGEVRMLDDAGMDLDLDFFTRETSFRTLLSLVPAIYLKDFELVETRGSLELTASIEGTMRDSLMPDAQLNLVVKDGFFAYPDLPKDVSDVQIVLTAMYDGADMDQSTVHLERFFLQLGGNPFEARMDVAHPLSDMHVAGAVKGLIDFASLKDVVPLEDLRLDGTLQADLSLDTRMSYIENEAYEKVDLEGRLHIEGMDLEGADLPVPVHLKLMEMNFTPRYVTLAAMDLDLGSSDLQLKGKLENFIPYVFEGKTVSGNLELSSRLLNANELMPAPAGADSTEMDVAAESPTHLPASGDTLEPGDAFKIPENIHFQLALEVNEVLYKDLRVSGIQGGAVLKDGVAYLQDLGLEVIEGTVGLNGLVDTRNEQVLAVANLDIRGIDIPLAYEHFLAVERLAPMARYIQGSANMDLSYNSALDASLSPLYESIQAKGRLYTNDVRFYNLKSFVTLSELLGNDKFKNAAPDNLDIKFRIQDGKVQVDPFDIKVENSLVNVSGEHGIDQSLNYLLDMDIAVEDLGEQAQQLMVGMNALAASAGLTMKQKENIKVKARITGTFDDPKVSTDWSKGGQSVRETATEVVEEKVREEVAKVEEEVREEASQKADEILREAEAQAEGILAEARKAGEKLVKEAQIQGEKLEEEAKKPWEKIAAREAAKELVRQAEKQQESLLKEAQKEADEILDKARKKAEEI